MAIDSIAKNVPTTQVTSPEFCVKPLPHESTIHSTTQPSHHTLAELLIIMKSESRSNKDLAKFETQIHQLADKWDD